MLKSRENSTYYLTDAPDHEEDLVFLFLEGEVGVSMLGGKVILPEDEAEATTMLVSVVASFVFRFLVLGGPLHKHGLH